VGADGKKVPLFAFEDKQVKRPFPKASVSMPIRL
jgi:hypothetical protein